MPLNARETGIFAGIALAALLRVLSGSWGSLSVPTVFWRLVLGGLVALGVLDGMFATLGDPFYVQTPLSKYWAGCLLGVGGGFLVAPYWDGARGVTRRAAEVFVSSEGALGALGLAFGTLFALHATLAFTPWVLGLVSSLGTLHALTSGAYLVFCLGPAARWSTRQRIVISFAFVLLVLTLLSAH